MRVLKKYTALLVTQVHVFFKKNMLTNIFQRSLGVNVAVNHQPLPYQKGRSMSSVDEIYQLK